MRTIVRYKRHCFGFVLAGLLISGGCSRTGLRLPGGAMPPPPPSDHNSYKVDCVVRIPVNRTTGLCPDEGDGFCTHSRSEWVSFPPELNPNSDARVAGAHRPTEAELEADAANRVTPFVREGLRFTYFDCRPQVTCSPHRVLSGAGDMVIETTRDAKSNGICPTIALARTTDPLRGFTNFDRATCILPPNQGACPLTSALCVCRPPSFDPPFTPPDGLLSSFLGNHSVGEITSGTANVTIEANPEVQTAVRGSIELTGGPCSAGTCNVGLAINWKADDIRMGGDTLTDITLVGAGESPGASLDARGAGTFAPGRFYMTVGATGFGTFFGRAISGSQAFFLSNSDPIQMSIGWESGAFAVDGSLRLVTGPIDKPVTALRVEIHVKGRLLNRPPTAVAGANQTIECSSPQGGMVSLMGRATDLDGNILSQLWKREPATLGEVVGATPAVTLRQGLGSQTYAFQVIDTFFQNSTSGLTVTVQDTTPPTILEPVIQVPCGWGGSCDDRQNPRLCVLLVGAAEDRCSSRVEMVVRSVQAFLECTGEPLGPPQQGNCIKADPRYWGDEISKIIYVMRYTARDESGNEAPDQTISFRIKPGGDSSGCPASCSEPRTIALNPCGR